MCHLEPVFVSEDTKTASPILSRAVHQSDCKAAGLPLILIDRNVAMKFSSLLSFEIKKVYHLRNGLASIILSNPLS